MKTLYISDLDGMLLQHDAEMSDYTRSTIRRLMDNGLQFSGVSVVFFCIKETKERLFSVVEQIRAIPSLYAPVYKDKYTDYWSCECARADASKSAAVRDLKKWSGYDKVVCFGDDLNDLPLFAACDECYAMANAAQEVKDRATAVIGSNDDDGVAKWLEENYL